MFKTIPLAEVRKINLQTLVDRFGQAVVARNTKRPDRQIGDMLAGRKSFGEKVARSMEAAWLETTDTMIYLDGAESPLVSETLSPADLEMAQALKRELSITTSWIPVGGYAQLGENGWYEEVQTRGADGFVEAHSSDPDAYALRVKGDSMFPAIRDGWYVVVEPNSSLASGEYVAIALTNGKKMVKEFLFRSPNGVQVQSVNGGIRLTVLEEDIQTIHPIGAVLMPSKHREA